VADLVESKPLSGFQDVLPAEALAFEEAVEKLRRVFRSYGYAPIDAPCIYRYETLTGGRAGIDKQLFEWRKKEGRDGEGEGEHVALRFDLTVPLARYVAANAPKLTFPFKRYDVGKVWRGERPQKGRFREFYQCDFDVVGTTAWSSDLEVALVMSDSLDALGVDKFQIRLNDRGILNGFLESLKLLESSAEVLRVIDKLDKVGVDGVRDELTRPAAAEKPGLGLATDTAERIVTWVKKAEEFADPERQKSAIFDFLLKEYGSNERARKGVERLRFVVDGARRHRGSERFFVDLSIARGLGYYTGTVYETVLLDAPEYGSVCSGGRYDDLASYYTKQRLPGVGASVGLSRLLAALQKLRPSAAVASPCPVLVVIAPDVDPREAVSLADELRRAGIGTEVYPQGTSGDEAAKLGKQFKYGDARGHSLVLILGQTELAKRALGLKDMKTEKQEDVPLDPPGSVTARVRERLAGR
jgi:histidyl-tRNA synthetase